MCLKVLHNSRSDVMSSDGLKKKVTSRLLIYIPLLLNSSIRVIHLASIVPIHTSNRTSHLTSHFTPRHYPSKKPKNSDNAIMIHPATHSARTQPQKPNYIRKGYLPKCPHSPHLATSKYQTKSTYCGNFHKIIPRIIHNQSPQ